MSHPFLANYRVILASGSPRRRDLLRQVGIPPDQITPSDIAEDLPKSGGPAQYTMATAAAKARHVWAAAGTPGDKVVVVGADTVVVRDGEILEKPRDRDHALHMLRGLSGRSHTVVTGVCLITPHGERTFHSETEVHFRQLSEEMMQWYVDTGEPMDKAGGYGTRELGAILVERVNGCYCGMMGLPVSELLVQLKEMLSDK